MKKLFLLSVLFISLAAMAQVPEHINYQAVARNNAGAALVNQTMKVRFTISRNAVAQYSETRQVTTNALGLFNVQIGSAGAISTTGTFNAVDWTNNTPNMALKVELDINNSGVFTDMGSQAFSSVPFALAAKTALTADNTEKIAGRPLDLVATPSVNSTLVWNGTNWTPVKKDTVIIVKGFGNSIPPRQSPNPAAWTFIDSETDLPTITVTGNETITGSCMAAYNYLYQGYYASTSVSMCYRNVAGGVVTSFTGLQPEAILDMAPTTGGYTQFTAVGGVKLPAGTYVIGMAIKNHSDQVTLVYGGHYSGVVEIKR